MIKNYANTFVNPNIPIIKEMNPKPPYVNNNTSI